MYPDNFDGTQGWDQGLHHNMEYVAYKAVEFIEDNAANDWFLYVNPTVPHGPSVEAAMDVDCRITTDGNFTESMADGWSVVGMTKEHGDDCIAYRNDVKARAGSNSDQDLGNICECRLRSTYYNGISIAILCLSHKHGRIASTCVIWHGFVNRGRRCHRCHLPSPRAHQTIGGYLYPLPARSWQGREGSTFVHHSTVSIDISLSMYYLSLTLPILSLLYVIPSFVI